MSLKYDALNGYWKVDKDSWWKYGDYDWWEKYGARTENEFDIMTKNIISLFKTEVKDSLNYTSIEQDGVLTIEFELPGVKKEDISIDFENKVLKVKAKKKDKEKSVDVFVSDKFNYDTTEATYENGLLKVTIKQKDTYSKKISIK